MKNSLVLGSALAACVASASVVTYDSATTGLIPEGIPAGAVVDKTGPGTVVANAVFRGSVFVKNGVLAVSPRRFAFSQYRFKVDAIIGSATGSKPSAGMEIGEFKLLCDGVDVTSGFTSVSNCPIGNGGGGNPSGEGPANAVDGKDWTKFLDKSLGQDQTDETAGNCYLQLVYSEPVEVTAYNWASCDYYYSGSSSRLPKSWRLQGSNDGVVWTDLDVREDFVPTYAAKVWQSADGFAIAGFDAAGQVLSVNSGAELDVSGIYQIGSLFNGGSVELSGNAALKFAPAEEETGVMAGGGISGGGGVVKDGIGDLQMLGTNTYCGETTICKGRLILGQGLNGATAAKWFRVTFKQNYTSSPALLDLAEWSFFDAEGIRVGVGLVKAPDGTDARELLPGTCCMAAVYTTGSSTETVEKLFDGNVNTKICLSNNLPVQEDQSTWRTLVVRLPNAARPVASYNFTAAADNSSGKARSPKVWLLEASFDGSNWFTVDEMTDPLVPSAPKTAYNGGTPMTLTQNINNNGYAAKWFRVTFKNTYSYGNSFLIGLSEWYLYDAEGNRCGMNLRELEAGTAPADMPPGSCCLADASYSLGSVNEGPSKLFDDNSNTKLCLTDLQMSSDSSTWRTVVVRMTDSTPAIVSHLFRVCDNTNGKDRSPNKWVVEASYNGLNWTPVETRDSVVYPTAQYELYNGGVPYGFVNGATGPKNMPAALPERSALKVMPGAAVIVADDSKVGALVADMAQIGKGAIVGFCPAERGTLYLEGYESGSDNLVELPVEISAARDLENLASWAVSVNGAAAKSVKFIMVSGTPYVKFPAGLNIIVR